MSSNRISAFAHRTYRGLAGRDDLAQLAVLLIEIGLVGAACLLVSSLYGGNALRWFLPLSAAVVVVLGHAWAAIAARQQPQPPVTTSQPQPSHQPVIITLHQVRGMSARRRWTSRRLRVAVSYGAPERAFLCSNLLLSVVGFLLLQGTIRVTRLHGPNAATDAFLVANWSIFVAIHLVSMVSFWQRTRLRALKTAIDAGQLNTVISLAYASWLLGVTLVSLSPSAQASFSLPLGTAASFSFIAGVVLSAIKRIRLTARPKPTHLVRDRTPRSRPVKMNVWAGAAWEVAVVGSCVIYSQSTSVAARYLTVGLIAALVALPVVYIVSAHVSRMVKVAKLNPVVHSWTGWIAGAAVVAAVVIIATFTDVGIGLPGAALADLVAMSWACAIPILVIYISSVIFALRTRYEAALWAVVNIGVSVASSCLAVTGVAHGQNPFLVSGVIIGFMTLVPVGLFIRWTVIRSMSICRKYARIPLHEMHAQILRDMVSSADEKDVLDSLRRWVDDTAGKPGASEFFLDQLEQAHLIDREIDLEGHTHVQMTLDGFVIATAGIRPPRELHDQIVVGRAAV